MEMHTALAALNKAQAALDVLAQVSEDAGYPARANSASELAMEIRMILQQAGWRLAQ